MLFVAVIVCCYYCLLLFVVLYIIICCCVVVVVVVVCCFCFCYQFCYGMILLFPAPFNRCYSIVEGKFFKDVNLIDVPKAENPKWQNISLANTGKN